jgi:putative peptidoglycan lipid II flippase
MVPGVAGLAAVQINLFVNSWLAAGLGTGAVSWLDYAFRLMYMPIGLFGVSIATASLPAISAHAATSDDTGIRHAVVSGLRLMLLLNLPPTLGLTVLATPIVALIFERGRFTPADTAATAAALAFYAPGLIGYSAVKLISPAFYAMGNSRVPVIASGASVALNICLNLILVRSLGHRGLALGTALSALLNAGILILVLRARLGGLEGRRLVTAVLKISCASIVMAGAAYYTDRFLHIPVTGPDVIAQGVRVGGSIAVGLGVLAVSTHLLGLEEIADLKRRVFGRAEALRH